MKGPRVLLQGVALPVLRATGQQNIGLGAGGGGGRHVGSCFRIQGKKLNHSGSTEAVWRVERNGGWLGVNTVRM